MNKKVKIKEQKSDLSLDSPQFIIEIEQAKSQDLQVQNNYEVLTKIIGTSDIVISLDSTLMNLPYQQRMQLIQQFLDSIRALDLEYKCQRAIRSNHTFLSMLLKDKSTEEQEILVYIPNIIWVDNAIQKILPFYGARYFITKNNANNQAILDDMQKMLDDEKLEYFRLIIFNSIYISSMGICSKYLSLSDLEEMLGIKHNT